MKELRDIFKYLPNNNLRLIYLALIEPIVSYGIKGWRGSYDNVLSWLKTSQNTLIKIALIR